MTDFGPRDWLAALEQELTSLATGTLGFPSVDLFARDAAPPRAMEGAYLGFVTSEGACQIGLAASAAGCESFARGLLGMGEGEVLSAPDVADAVCEIVNVLAGGVKRRAREAAGLQATPRSADLLPRHRPAHRPAGRRRHRGARG